jgi:asparagine synthase (glutamine-hydrolysing)
MSGFLALRWPPQDALATGLAETVRQEVSRKGPAWRPAVDRPGWLVFIQRAAEWVQLSEQGDAVIIGRLFSRAGCLAPTSALTRLSDAPSAFASACRTVVDDGWGAYVALQANLSDPQTLSIFRDPIGALDCATWTCGGMRLVASEPGLWLSAAPPAGVGINWRQVRDLLVFPGSVQEGSPLEAVEAVPAGCLLCYRAGQRSTERLWSPRGFCAASPEGTDPAALRRVVEHSVATWRKGDDAIVSEISGGLDSAIVAASGISAGAVRTGYHFFTRDPLGDERRYARCVAHGLGVPLVEIECHARFLVRDELDSMPIGFRPGLGSTSLFHDRELARQIAASGAGKLVTGHGGDALFFQTATPAIAADLRRWPPREYLAHMMDLATWTRLPLWRIAWASLGLSQAGNRVAAEGNQMPFLRASDHRPARKAEWQGNLAGLPPAKQIHVDAIANSRSAFGISWCSQETDVVHPLMSQPIIEHVLALPAMVLTRGRRDRALVREAYAGHLPAAIVNRRSKGALAFHFGRVLAASTDMLRSYLLDGTLVANALLDRRALEPVLQSDSLMRIDHYSQLLTIILIEQWARTWEGRLGEMARQRWARGSPAGTDRATQTAVHTDPGHWPGSG